jgi:hypothetical protein
VAHRLAAPHGKQTIGVSRLVEPTELEQLPFETGERVAILRAARHHLDAVARREHDRLAHVGQRDENAQQRLHAAVRHGESFPYFYGRGAVGHPNDDEIARHVRRAPYEPMAAAP